MLEGFFSNKMCDILPKNIDTLVVAVSGGADSLALCFLAHDYAKKYNLNFYALTVDHDLREGSAYEAHKVNEMLKSYDINHSILLWKHEGNVKRIHENARKARYELMLNFCKTKSPDCALLTAHHFFDQTETILMRLLKGSGLKGLIGIPEIIYMQEVLVLRPLLEQSSDILKAYLNDKKINWFEDPSNNDEKFERTRIRKLLGYMRENGFLCENINLSSKKLESNYEFIKSEISDWAKKFVISDDPLVLNQVEFFKVPEFVQNEFLREKIFIIGGGSYAKPRSSISAILKILKSPKVSLYKVAGCEISVSKKNIFINKLAFF